EVELHDVRLHAERSRFFGRALERAGKRRGGGALDRRRVLVAFGAGHRACGEDEVEPARGELEGAAAADAAGGAGDEGALAHGFPRGRVSASAQARWMTEPRLSCGANQSGVRPYWSTSTSLTASSREPPRLWTARVWVQSDVMNSRKRSTAARFVGGP